MYEEEEETNECNYCGTNISIDKKWCSERCYRNDQIN